MYGYEPALLPRNKETLIDGTTARVRRTSRDERQFVVVLAFAAGALATMGGAAPTGIAFVDVVYVVVAGSALGFAGGRARRITWLMSGAAALWVTPSTTGRLVAIAAIAIAIYAARTGRRRALGAAVGALLAFTLGNLGTGPFHGSTTIFAAVAALPMIASALLVMPESRRRMVGVALSLWATGALAATMVFGVSAVLSIGDVGRGVDAVNRGFDLGSEGDEDGAADEFDDASSQFEDARSKVSGFWTLPARLVPVVGQHAQAVQVVASEGVALTQTAADTARTVDPDDIRIVDGRIDLDVIEDLVPTFDRAEDALDRAHLRVSEVRNPWLVPLIDDRLVELLDELDDARPAAHTAALAVRELPTMLGSTEPVNWLIAMTTPAEARGLGGLLGNWTLVQANNGELSIIAAGRNEDINARLRSIEAELRGPEQYLDRWGKYTPEQFFQDVTLSPDLPMVAEVTADLFTQATDMSVDGVVFLDPYSVAAILDLTGPVQTSDRRLTSANVVPFLLEGQYEYDNELLRVAVLAELVERTFVSFTSGALPGAREVAAALGPVVAQDRLGIAWLAGGGPGELIDDIGVDGRFPITEGEDLLAVVHQNSGQNKLDVFLQRRVEYELEVIDGVAAATITVTLTNELTDLTLPVAVIANNDQGFPLGTNVALVTVHTAFDLREARLDGEVISVGRASAFGHDAITTTVEIPPGEQRTLEITVGGRFDLGADGYRLVLPHQPLVNDDEMNIRAVIEGVTVIDLNGLRLDADLVIGSR